MTEAAVFDVRVWIEADTAEEVYARVTEVVRVARLFAPPGVRVRYSALRPGHHLSQFKPTIEPRRRKRAA